NEASMKNIKLIIVIMLVFNGWSQTIKNSAGQLVDGDFEGCSVVDASSCYYLENLTFCSNWEYDTNASGMMCYQNVFSNGNGYKLHAYSGRAHGVLIKKVEDTLVSQMKLKAFLSGLIVGNSYTLSFYHLNHGVAPSEAEGLDTGFSIQIGDET